MAQDFSAHYLQQLSFRQLPELYLRIGGRRILEVTRRLERNIRSKFLSRDKEVRLVREPLITSRLEASQKKLRRDGWAFVEKILEERFHAELRSCWPKRCYLRPASDLRKSWDRGFEWRRGQAQITDHFLEHPELESLLADLRSDAFAERVTKLVDATEPLSCFSFVVTATVSGSVVAPHRDDWAFLSDGPQEAYNLVLFIDGTGGAQSGGLSILGTNTFDEMIFESTSLRNTALIYDTKAPFYHGFPPVRRGKFRHAIISNFVSSDFAG